MRTKQNKRLKKNSQTYNKNITKQKKNLKSRNFSFKATTTARGGETIQFGHRKQPTERKQQNKNIPHHYYHLDLEHATNHVHLVSILSLKWTKSMNVFVRVCGCELHVWRACAKSVRN